MSFLCRYGHQDVYRILGRDPVTSPLSELEASLFERALQEHVEAEFTPRAERMLVAGRAGGED